MARTSIAFSLGTILTLAGLASGQDALGDGRSQQATDSTRNALGSANALGDGHALDGSSLVGGDGRNRRRFNPIQANIRFQNAIVTGNVSGGRYFRGDLGYTAASDFRGATAGDLVFDLDRNAFRSGFALRNIRGVEGSRRQARFNSGGFRDPQSQQLIISRPAAGRDAGQVRERASQGGREYDGLAEIDTAIRSTAAFNLRTTERPALLGSRTRNGVAFPVGISPLTGIREYLTTDSAISTGRFDFSRSDLLNPVDLDPTTPRDELEDRFGFDTDDNEAASNAITPEILSPHETLMQQLRSRLEQQGVTQQLTDLSSRNSETDPDQSDVQIFDPRGMANQNADAEDEPTDPSDQILRRLSELLGEGAEPLPGETAPRTTPLTLEEMLQSAREREARSQLGLLNDDTAAEVDELPFDAFIGVIDALLEATQEDTEFINNQVDEDEQTAYERRMADGQQALQNAMWFDAEEFFVAALTVNRGDGLASIGRIAAQLGGGMYRSASAGIRETFLAYPELARIKLDAELLPSEERVDSITAELRSIVAQSDAAALDSTITLAWLGYQTNNQPLIAEAFAALRSITESAQIEVRGIDLMLERLWMAKR